MSSVTNLFLVRHGQTEWNKEHRLQGHKNSPLTQKGKEQALNTKHALQDYEIHKAYVSPLQRASRHSRTHY
ncbi:histidine phosphatase family protein [Marinomonas sp. GJ51-6]|uniref:histidine phosphatase family protein n=1 Tax=Marinomonas sp. GJ51-6 TaxID=2992802 RepID=UPI00397734B9